MYAQDDFPLSSNFTGSKIQLDIDTGMGMKIDLRLYTQETKNEDITIDSNSTAMEGKNKITRTQLNLNVPF
jgi:low affinity Fe/Cu permease